MKKLGNVYCFIFFFSLLVFDQLSKYLIRLYDGFYICNLGISFGIQLPNYLFWILWIGIIAVLLYFISKKTFFLTQIPLILVLAGAISNIIDRFYLGCVIDFIDLKIWPVFNFADISISIGAIMLVITIFKKKK